MANHVSTHIAIYTNEQGQQAYNDICSLLKRDPDPYEKNLMYAFSDDPDDFYQYMTDKVGAKWAYTVDISECSMVVQSAWSYVEPFCEYLAQQIGKVDPNVQLIARYEDEMPNFVGVSVFDHDGLYDLIEADEDQLREYIHAHDSEIAAEWDDELQQYSDKGLEYYIESLWDHVGNWQDEQLIQLL